MLKLTYKAAMYFLQKNIANEKNINNKIVKGIADKFGYQVQVIIETPDELGYALKNNPFIKSKRKM